MNWDDYFVLLCIVIAQRSKDPRSKHGSIIVNSNNKIISTGYNGYPSKVNESMLPGLDTDGKYDYIIHSEMNSLLFAGQDVRGCTIYVSGFPCRNCFKHIIQSGIKRIVIGPITYKNVDTEMDIVKTLYNAASDVSIEIYNNNDLIIKNLDNTKAYLLNKLSN